MPALKTHGLLAANDINGTAILSENGDEVGTVDHLVVDPIAGKIAYAVVSFGGFLGLGEQTYSIPWGTVRFDPDTRVFVTRITRDQIEAAPDRPDDWQLDRRWEERTFDYFGVPPYWI